MIPLDLEKRIQEIYKEYKNPPLKEESVGYTEVGGYYQGDPSAPEYITEYRDEMVPDRAVVASSLKELLNIFVSLEDKQDRDKIANLLEWGVDERNRKELDRTYERVKRGDTLPPELLKKAYKCSWDSSIRMAAGRRLGYSQMRINMTGRLKNVIYDFVTGGGLGCLFLLSTIVIPSLIFVKCDSDARLEREKSAREYDYIYMNQKDVVDKK